MSCIHEKLQCNIICILMNNVLMYDCEQNIHNIFIFVLHIMKTHMKYRPRNKRLSLRFDLTDYI